VTVRVFFQVAFLREGCTASQTTEGFLACVYSKMAFQVSGLRKPGRANLAHERLLARMRAQVFGEVRFLCERLEASLALVRSHLAVNALLMLLKIARYLERLSAHVTLDGWCVAVMKLMSAQLPLRRERQLTHFALEGCATLVCHHVFFEVERAYERLLANIAFVRPL